MSITVAIVLDQRRKKKSGKFAVKLRVTHKRNYRLYPLNMDMTIPEFDKVMDPKAKGARLRTQTKLHEHRARALKIADDLSPFSFSTFKNIFLDKYDVADVFSILEELAKEKDNINRIGSAQHFRSTISVLQDFLPPHKKKLPANEIDVKWMQRFEHYMINERGKTKGKRNVSIGTVGSYARDIRTALNVAKKNGQVKEEDIPFGKGYTIRNKVGRKRALSLEQVEKLAAYEPKSPYERKMYALWFFCYFCNGLDMKDLASLQYKDYNPDNHVVSWVRHKTKFTSQGNQKPIFAKLPPAAVQIMDLYGKSDPKPNQYIFDIINENESAESFEQKTNKACEDIKKVMTRIGKELGVAYSITYRTARHSYATHLMNVGAPLMLISTGLGHSTSKMTSNYMAGFEDEVVKSYQDKIHDRITPSFKTV